MDGWERGTQKGQLTQPGGQGGLPKGELIEVNKNSSVLATMELSLSGE